MLKLLTVLSVVVVISSNSSAFNDPDRPIITTSGGQLQGERLECGLFCNYYSFKGIPYAEPPVGNLRFRSPVPHAGWEGVRQAAQHGNICPQPTEDSVIGNEDCLFLNVYTQDLIGSRPVMVFIHGGGFNVGSGNSNQYGPQYFVQDGILLVTFNYRLNMLGYLSTGDRYAQGNYALKDMVEALRWIRANIAAFGGNPDNVTVFGESAGASAIHYLLLSPMATGLYHKAIAQSGTVIGTAGFQPNPREMAFEFAENIGVSTASSEALVNELRQLSVESIVAFLPPEREPFGLRPADFSPSIESGDSEEPRFLTAHPISILRSGVYNHVPLIMGFNDAETLFAIRLPVPADVDSTFVPAFWNVPAGSPAEHEIANTFRDFYWNGAPLTNDLSFNYIQYTTDHVFAYGIDLSAEIYSQNQEEDVFYYKFTFDGDLNGLKILYDLRMYPGANHNDELFYMFVDTRIPAVATTNPAYTVRQRMVRMWTNFAKYGHPTYQQDDMITTNWIPVQGAQEYMNIGADLTVGMSPSPARINMWRDLSNRFANF